MVPPGTSTLLGGARGAWAGYLSRMHGRVHPYFADSFVPSMPADEHPEALVTRIEIGLDASGTIARMGVLKSSGSRRFDIGVLDALERAAPFGPVPADILSSDGRVYVHWDFRGDRQNCSTINATPYVLATSP